MLAYVKGSDLQCSCSVLYDCLYNAHYTRQNVDLQIITFNMIKQCFLSCCFQSITPNTILLAASAPQYCHGAVDPIPQLSELAVKRGLPLHIDACFGGFMLPW